MQVFCTVGSTKFDSFTSQIFSPAVQSALRAKGYTQIIVQHGHSQIDSTWQASEGINIELYPFKASLEDDYKKADLIISHAGKSFRAVTQRGGD
jgi:beta-1,4-N-acetylglucosaminyltransferase